MLNRSKRVSSLIVACAMALQSLLASGSLQASEPPDTSTSSPQTPSPPDRVDVKPVARDQEIQSRLQNVLEATEWFQGPQVQVDQGVVVLTGQTETQELKDWANELASNTQDVVAVVNKIDVSEPSAWNFAPAWAGARELWRDFMRTLPLLGVALVVLALSAGAGVFASRLTQRFLRERLHAQLLQRVLARSVGLLVVLGGMYLVLRIGGLTQLALTIVGGTGLVGLILGIAFRDISENFLASIFLSAQKPFETGDLIEVAGSTGFVQQLNMRTTVLMTLEGSILQVPNSTVYKSVVRNYSSNANRREDFVVGIGYEDSIDAAQEVARKVLEAHPAILNDPEPLVLADSLGKATVNLRVYFWLDGTQHSWLKVRSSAIRLVKRAFQERGISMPDEARELIFPRGVPVTIEQHDSRLEQEPRVQRGPEPTSSEQAACNKAEAGLSSEAQVIQRQARNVRPLEGQENLLSTGPRRPNG